jgi:hypothetical protein
MIRSLLAAALVVVPLLADAALAADPPLVGRGDRVGGSLSASEPEAGVVFDGLAGTVLTLKVKRKSGNLEPGITIGDPDGYEVPLAGVCREGGRKARVRGLVLPQTGRYLIVVRLVAGAEGTYRLKIEAEHPRKVRQDGVIASALIPRDVVFPAFAGTTVRVKVKGKEGLITRVDTVIRPDVSAWDLTGGRLQESVFRHDGFACTQHGDHRLRSESRDGTTGAYRARLKLRHPESAAAARSVDGATAWTFLGALRSRSDPGPPPPPSPSPPPPEPTPPPEVLFVRATSQTSTFRLSVGTVGEWHRPWPRSRPVRFFIRLENLKNEVVSIWYSDGAWASFDVLDPSGTYLVWGMYERTTQEPTQDGFGPLQGRLVKKTWDPSGVAPGTYPVKAWIHSNDPRIPAGLSFSITIQ